MNLDITGKIWLCAVAAAVVFLPLIFCEIWNRRRLARRILEEDTYFMRMPPAMFFVGAACVLVFFAVTAAVIFVLDANIIALLFFLGFTFLAECYCYMVLFYEIKCEADSLTVYRPFLPPKRIRFYEITKVLYVEHRRGAFAGGTMHLYLYRGKKKFLDVEDEMSGFERLLEKFMQEGRLERGLLKENGLELEQTKDSFAITATTADRVRAAFLSALFGGILIAVLVNGRELYRENSGEYLVYLVGFLLFTVINLTELMRTMLWRVTVSWRTIMVRDSLGRTASYSMGELTEALERKHDLELYAAGKMIVRIRKDNKNYALLTARLRQMAAVPAEDSPQR